MHAQGSVLRGSPSALSLQPLAFLCAVHPRSMCVDVEALAAGEADQGDAAGLGAVDGETLGR
jgi:hypothetical protein